jgi:hypothetical protein
MDSAWKTLSNGPKNHVIRSSSSPINGNLVHGEGQNFGGTVNKSRKSCENEESLPFDGLCLKIKYGGALHREFTSQINERN